MPNAYNDNDIYSTSVVQSTDIFKAGDEAWRIDEDHIQLGMFANANVEEQQTDSQVVKAFIPFAADVSGLDWSNATLLCCDAGNIAYTKTRQAATKCVRAYNERHAEKKSENKDTAAQRTWSEEELRELIEAYANMKPILPQVMMLMPTDLHRQQSAALKHRYNLPVQTPQDVQEFSKTLRVTTHVIAKAITDYITKQLDLNSPVDCSIKTDVNGNWYASVTAVPHQDRTTQQNIMVLFATERGYALVPSAYGHPSQTCIIEQKQCEKIISELTGLKITASVKPVNAPNIIFLGR